MYKAAKLLKLNYQNAKAIVRKAKLCQSQSGSEDEFEAVEELPCKDLIMSSSESRTKVSLMNIYALYRNLWLARTLPRPWC